MLHEEQAQESPQGMQIIIEDQQEDFQSDIKDKKRRGLPRSPSLRRKGVATYNYQSNQNQTYAE